MYALT